MLKSGGQVKLSGFGNFNLLEKKPRPGRNPKTGEDVSIAPRRVVAFGDVALDHWVADVKMKRIMAVLLT
ncbi:hypothetical protein CCP4SC76_6820001 [Gammaproteobacteria bacterium]